MIRKADGLLTFTTDLPGKCSKLTSIQKAPFRILERRSAVMIIVNIILLISITKLVGECHKMPHGVFFLILIHRPLN